jgi:hypothetical protein
MELIQIGETKAPETVSIQQMFMQLAEREAQMIRECLAKVESRNSTAARMRDSQN